MSNTWNKFFGALSLLLLVAFSTWAQPKYNSPYSRLGLGDPFDQNFVGQSGMAGLSTAFNDPFHLNILNPASYSHLASTAFELGINSRYSSLKNVDGSQANVWGGNLSYLALGFPLRNPLNDVLDPRKRDVKLGMALALVPFTNVGYNIETTGFIPGGDSVQYVFKGTGGTYRFMWGNSIQYKNFSFGVNLSYLFGKISREHQVIPDLLGSYRLTLVDDFSVSGFVWDAGVQYDVELDKDRPADEDNKKKLTLGLSGNSNNSFNTNSSSLHRSYNFSYNDIDTISMTSELKGKGTLPAALSISAMYVDINKLKLGLQFDFNKWSSYANDAKPEALEDSYRVAIGGEYIPDYSSYNNYRRRIRYRAGAFYAKDPRSVFNSSLTNYGINFGLGLPLVLSGRRTSFVNLALELGKFGTTSSLQETYAKLSIGFTLNDNSWFFKRKFN